mgnify:CR=1 FL=1
MITKPATRTILALLSLFFLQQHVAWASGGPDQEEGINASEIIIDHVIDSHSWHIMTLPNGTHVSVHLPVILYSQHTGLQVFSSSHLAHGHAYEAGESLFELKHQGPDKGDIVETLSDGTTYKPLDFSITKNVVAVFFSMIIILALFIGIANKYKKNPNAPPSGMQSLFEPLIIFIRDEVAKESIGEKHYRQFAPYLLSVFFFILFNNLLGLIPLFPMGANVTGNLSATAALAFFTFATTTIKGNKNYWKHIFNTPGIPWWMKLPLPIMPIIEFSQIFTRPIVLAIRLFANILAGHIIVLSFFTLIFIFGSMYAWIGLGVSPISLVLSLFMSLLELLVAFIQAYVFTLLSAIYLGMAKEEAH